MRSGVYMAIPYLRLARRGAGIPGRTGVAALLAADATALVRRPAAFAAFAGAPRRAAGAALLVDDVFAVDVFAAAFFALVFRAAGLLPFAAGGDAAPAASCFFKAASSARRADSSLAALPPLAARC